jgi:lipoprotein signal peptidase
VLCFLNACKFLIMYVRLVLEGGLTNLYDMVWATCVHDMGVMVPFEVPSAASESTMSFPNILV